MQNSAKKKNVLSDYPKREGVDDAVSWSEVDFWTRQLFVAIPGPARMDLSNHWTISSGSQNQ